MNNKGGKFMNEMLSQEEIDELLELIKNETSKLSIIEIRPSQIEEISDYGLREQMKYQFDVVSDLFIGPLEKVFNHIVRINNYEFNFNTNDLSIIERMRAYGKMLLRSGYTSSQIFDLVPQNLDDIRLILLAKENGFVDNKILNNKSRLTAVKDYLDHLENIHTLQKVKNYK